MVVVVLRPAPGRLPLIFRVVVMLLDALVGETVVLVVRPDPGRLPPKILANPLLVVEVPLLSEDCSAELLIGAEVVVVVVLRPVTDGRLPPKRLTNSPVAETVLVLTEDSVVVLLFSSTERFSSTILTFFCFPKMSSNGSSVRMLISSSVVVVTGVVLLVLTCSSVVDVERGSAVVVEVVEVVELPSSFKELVFPPKKGSSVIHSSSGSVLDSVSFCL